MASMAAAQENGKRKHDEITSDDSTERIQAEKPSNETSEHGDEMNDGNAISPSENAKQNTKDTVTVAKNGAIGVNQEPDEEHSPLNGQEEPAVMESKRPRKRTKRLIEAPRSPIKTKPAKAKTPAKKPANETKKASAANDQTAKEKKKRKVRTMEQKHQENAAMGTPFYVENGADWNNTDINFDDLATLRHMWELPAACHILWLLQTPLKLRFSNTLLEYEAALLNPETSVILEDVFTKLLLKKSERECLTAGIGLKYEWWNKQLREYYVAMYDKWYALLRKAGEKVPSTKLFLESDEEEDDDDAESIEEEELTDDEWMTLEILKTRLETLGKECPLRHKSFAELSAPLRCKILLNLCQAVMDDPANTNYIRQMEEDDLRVQPFGRDRVGNFLFFFPQFYEERRIYRLETNTLVWTLWAKGEESIRAMYTAMKTMKGRRVRGEQETLDHLEVILEQLEEEAREKAKQLEKATRRAILEAIPRKRSLRLQVKQLEQLEKQQEEPAPVKKEAVTEEEIAEQKRLDLLRRVERAAEREAKKQEQEQREREAAIAERELRRQRRVEQDYRELEAQERAEAERKRQEEARKQRAQQRKGTENPEQDDLVET